MPPELISVFLIVGLIVVVIATYLTYKQGQAAKKTWKKIAEELDGSYTSGSVDGSPGSIEINAEVDKKLVRVTLDRNGMGRNKAVTTSMSSFTGTNDLRLQIHRRGTISLLPTVLFGMKNIALDDTDFDRSFKVTTNDTARTKLWLDADIRRALLNSQQYSFEIAENEARALMGSIDCDERRLKGAMSAVAALAGGGQRLVEDLEAISQELGTSLKHVSSEALGGVEYQLETDRATVKVDVVQQFVGVITVKTLTWTRIRATNTRKVAPFLVRAKQAPKDAVDAAGLEAATPLAAQEGFRENYEVHVASADRVDELFSKELLQGIAATSPTLLASDGEEITALVEDYLTDKDRLRALIELVAKLAGKPLAPYR